eukprot:1355178-Rhodomonas_salina.3
MPGTNAMPAYAMFGTSAMSGHAMFGTNAMPGTEAESCYGSNAMPGTEAESCYAMSGTEMAMLLPGWGIVCSGQGFECRRSADLAAYAAAMECPVLTERMVLSGVGTSGLEMSQVSSAV